MGMMSDEIVVIRQGQRKGDPAVITVNCPDKVGLGCDLSRIIFEFGFCIVKGDISTDCKWCYVIFWVVPNGSSCRSVDWAMLKNRLVAVCPPSSLFLYYVVNPEPKPKQVYLLQVSSVDRAGLLNDVSQALWELELTIHKVKVWTMPDGNVMDLFYITDNRELLHTKKRQDDACNYLKKMLGESSTYCQVRLTSPEFGGLECTTTSLSPSITENMFNKCLSELEKNLQSEGGDGKLNKVSVTFDNSLSPAHTLLQIVCKNQKGLTYDVMRTLKDFNIQVSYGRLSTNAKGNCEMDLFTSQADGKKILDEKKQNALRSRLKMEIINPLRVMVASRGPDTELLVATPIELSGRGRPSVLYDVTLALKQLGISIFTADIGRNIICSCQWEVYRFLLIDRPDLSLGSICTRNRITEHVRNMLMA
uniref:ACT domain-containing protein n=1 Tax=Araucaria cunninghamii TaxID=56994 RepID=A0A0D6QY35_ARACU